MSCQVNLSIHSCDAYFVLCAIMTFFGSETADANRIIICLAAKLLEGCVK